MEKSLDDSKQERSTPDRERIGIVVTNGPVRGLSCWSNVAESMVVGRAKDCQLRVADARMSREHFVARFSDGCWWLHDMASSNGTMVNRRRISEPVEVKSGDIVAAGDTRFKVVISEDELVRADGPNSCCTDDACNHDLGTGSTTTLVDGPTPRKLREELRKLAHVFRDEKKN